MMPKAFLSLGSNLGNRLEYLRAAVEALRRGSRIEVLAVSRVYRTEPVEVGESQPEYLNCVVEVRCEMPAVELMRFCQGVEAALGRERKGERAPRTLDMDLLVFGREVLDTPGLIVPHPGVTRAFNLRGLADLDQNLYIPGYDVVRELLAKADPSGVRELEGKELC